MGARRTKSTAAAYEVRKGELISADQRNENAREKGHAMEFPHPQSVAARDVPAFRLQRERAWQLGMERRKVTFHPNNKAAVWDAA